MRRFGGSKRNGIAYSAKTPNVFIFTDPVPQAENVYHDYWIHPARSFTFTTLAMDLWAIKTSGARATRRSGATRSTAEHSGFLRLTGSNQVPAVRSSNAMPVALKSAMPIHSPFSERRTFPCSKRAQST